MRRLMAVVAVLLGCVLGVPGAAQAAPLPLGSGAVLFDPLGGTSQQCTAAFAATNGVDDYLIAGPTCTGGDMHTEVNGDWPYVGPVVAVPFPYNGYVIVQVTRSWELVPWVPAGNSKIVLKGWKETPVGGPVCHADPRVGLTCGTVTAVGQTYAFPWGPATNLTENDICIGTNLGAAFITGDQAQGVPLGGGNICTFGSSYYLPITPILNRYGLKLIVA
ncbi:S1 family peptidase [Actinophytocola sp.]|uniref:S1 family peptidase n=1 Tax=Actinophytocola sp. TaxID=1872138 RepID=UPI002ED3DAB0